MFTAKNTREGRKTKIKTNIDNTIWFVYIFDFAIIATSSIQPTSNNKLEIFISYGILLLDNNIVTKYKKKELTPCLLEANYINI